MSRRGNLGTLFAHELRQVVRDRRTILIVVLAPLVLYPLLIIPMRWSEERRQEVLTTQVYDYAVTGPAAEWGREITARATDLPPDSAAVAHRLEEISVENAEEILRAAGLDLVVEVTRPDSLEAPLFTLKYRTDSEFSRTAYQAMAARLARVRQEEREDAFLSRGFPVPLGDVGEIEERNLATAGEEGGALLAIVLTPLLVLMMVGGGAVVASDAISGEKERGTLETLLTTGARRREIVGAKLLAIAAVGVAVTLFNVVSVLAYVVIGLVDVPEGFSLAVPPATLALLLVLYLPVAVLVAAVLLFISGYSKTFKEYQIYALPATFVFIVPALAGALPGVDLRSAIAAVPLAGISVAVREVLTGEFDWTFLSLAFACTTGAAVWVAHATTGFLSRERLVTAAELDVADLEGGEILFRRHVLVWFGLLWVLLLVTSLWLQGDLGIRGQVLWNLVVLFLGASLLILWRYRLDPRRALALRRPHPAVWLAVLVGVPSAQLTGVSVTRLAELLFPVPDQVVEALGQYLLPEGIPFWQILIFLTVLPGICEEIAFRGVLLYGLRKSLTPVKLALAVGLIFGFFHVDLFRILPTAYIGILLTAVVLLTGSIFPAMLWHALNNALALFATRSGVPLDQIPASLSWLGLGGLAVAGWILWRTRRPYPDLSGGGGRASRGGGPGPGEPGRGSGLSRGEGRA